MKQATLWNVKNDVGPLFDPINAALELGAYEAMWTEQNASFKSLAEKFAESPDARPSDFIPSEQARLVASRVIDKLRGPDGTRFDVRVRGELEYPERLRQATHPVELLYFQGRWELIATRSVAVVGTRKPSAEGLSRVRHLVKRLVQDQFTIVSGLAEGVDTEAHNAAIAAGGQTIAVIGTPLNHVYPKIEREPAGAYSEGPFADQPSPAGAIRGSKLPYEPFLFPRKEQDDVGPHRGDHHR